MAVSNGELANATTFNNAFMDKDTDTNTIGRVDLQNTNPASGSDVINAQREINSLNSFSGRPSGSAYNAGPTWVNNDVGSSGDDLKDRSDSLTAKFNNVSGHAHTGASGDGAPIDGSDLINIPLRGFVQEPVDVSSITGGSTDVSSEMTGKSPSSGSAVTGVPVTSPYNRVSILDQTTENPFEDGSGNEVYGRLTESSGTWTLTYYSLVSGTETAYSFSGTEDIRWFYQELFSILDPNIPVYAQEFFIPSQNATADVVDASTSQRGLVSTGTQSFSGAKTFTGSIATTGNSAAGGGTITALTSTKSLVYITGAGSTTIQGATSGTEGQILVIHNLSSGTVTVKHQDAGASASNRFLLPNGDDVSIDSDSSAEFFYETGGSRWKLRAGSGTGSGAIGAQESIGTGDGSTTTFGPLTYVPLSEDSINVFVNGLIVDSADWSLSGINIVFGTAPTSASDIYVSYLTNGSPALPVLPSGTFQSYWHTVTGGEATAKQITLSPTPATPSQVAVDIKGGGPQVMGDDFDISGSTFDWSGYALDGILTTGDKIRFIYTT